MTPIGNRLLAEVELEPIQGQRFQPTGFPSLGAAEFTVSRNEKSQSSILVESAQSMANRLERVCMNEEQNSLVPVLEALPVITLKDTDGFVTNSILESHRMNSPYLLKKNNQLYKKINDELDADITRTKAIDTQKFARFVFKYDTNAILHGLFLVNHKESGGRYRLTRAISSFIEATGSRQAVSGGVKLDRLDPKGGDGGSKEGYGHVPYQRIEYTAESIKAYFDIDLALIRSYGLPEAANDFLFTFALWKIQSFLSSGLRLRTACSFKVAKPLAVIQPVNFKIPDLTILEEELSTAIQKCKHANLFCESPIIITK